LGKHFLDSLVKETITKIYSLKGGANSQHLSIACKLPEARKSAGRLRNQIPKEFSQALPAPRPLPNTSPSETPLPPHDENRSLPLFYSNKKPKMRQRAEAGGAGRAWENISADSLLKETREKINSLKGGANSQHLNTTYKLPEARKSAGRLRK
jgi:hypothetical protein